jgi:hypothetical protein
MKHLILLFALVSLAAAQNKPGNEGGLPSGVANGSVRVSKAVSQPMGHQIQRVIDVTDQGFIGNGSTDNTAAANTLLTAIGATQTTILFPTGRYVVGSVTFPANVALDFTNGAMLAPSTGQTITIAGPILASPTRIFTNIASGQGAISLAGNRTLTRISPLWWGLDCTGTNDNAPVWTRILTFTGDNSTFILPNNCTDLHGSQVTVSSRAGFKLLSETRSQNGAGNTTRPVERWTGNSSSVGMWLFSANQAPTIEGFAFDNNTGSPGALAFFLSFDGDPSTYIGTEAMVRYNTFTNDAVNTTGFEAVSISPSTSENQEKNVVSDNDFFCSQSSAFHEAGGRSDSGQISSGSDVLTCGAGNCTFRTDGLSVGERVRVTYAAGILDTTISFITDNNHIVMAANATSNQSNARVFFGQAYGYGIGVHSVNAKHNTFQRDSFTQCARGLNIITGSFSAEHLGGSANDVLAYVGDVTESSELAYMEDENSMRDLYTGAGSFDSPLVLSHMRNSTLGGSESDGFLYFGDGGSFTIESSLVDDAVITNAVLMGFGAPGNPRITSIGNSWSPGGGNMAAIGWGTLRNTFETSSAENGFLISCGDAGITDIPGACFQFGDNGPSTGTQGGIQQGNVVISSRRSSSANRSFSTITVEPNASATFTNEAIGFSADFDGSNETTSMKFIGFDAYLSSVQGYSGSMRGGNTVGFRFTMPTIGSTASPFARGLWVRAPQANTLITTGTGVYIEDLAAYTGITNRYSFYGVGSTDTAHFGGPTEQGGKLSFLTDNSYDIGGSGANRPRNVYVANQFISQVATGRAPFSITSTTPVANLTLSNHPEVYEAGVLTTAEKIYTNTQALTRGAATHKFANNFTFTSSSTFGCTCTDQTTANACKAVPASATTVILAGTGSDTLWLSCSGH